MTEPVGELERKLIKRAALRIVPFLMICYLVSYIDRVNIGFASLQMDRMVHLSQSIFGLGAGLYFISYVLFEVPSNMLIGRFGVRLFLTRIMLLWGVIACAMALVTGTWSFLTLRLLLGAAEAGLFPGVILYLTFWFPRAYRGALIGWFAVAIPISGMVGSPISAALLQLDHVWGFAGWQWLFVLEGLPAILLGIVAYFYIADGPAQARWMTPDERDVYAAMLERDELLNAPPPAPKVSVWRMLVDPTVLGLAVVLAASSTVSNTLAVWAPRFFKSYGLSNTAVGWLNAAPYLLGAIAMVAAGYSSDRRKERIWHSALPLLVSAVAMILMLANGQFLFAYAMITLSILGIYAAKSPIWTAATEWLPAEIKTVGIAQVNAVSSLISFFPIYLVGISRDAHGSYAVAFLPIAIITVIGALIMLAMGARRRASATRLALAPA